MNEYLDSSYFIAIIGVAWADRYESSKGRFRKVYPNLVLLLYHLPEFLVASFEHEEYNNAFDVEEGDFLSKAMPLTPMKTKNIMESYPL